VNFGALAKFAPSLRRRIVGLQASPVVCRWLRRIKPGAVAVAARAAMLVLFVRAMSSALTRLGTLARGVVAATRALRLRVFGLRQPAPAQVRAAARNIYGPCVLCREALVGHEVTLLGSAIVSEKSQSETSLREMLAAKNWQGAGRIYEWRGDADELEYRLVRCPWNFQLTLLGIRSFAALEYDDYIESREVLSEAESTEVQRELELRWESL
jgi:hypothetical protein